MSNTSKLSAIAAGVTFALTATATSANTALLWRNQQSGVNYLHNIENGAVISKQALNTVSDTTWKVVANADFDGNGHSDILWHNASTGSLYLYLMKEQAILSSQTIATLDSADWEVKAAADFNNDGYADVFVRNAATGENKIYYVQNGALSKAVTLNVIADFNWVFSGAGDLNNDGYNDIVWRNAATGANVAYFMGANNQYTVKPINTIADAAWVIQGMGDLNGDGYSDIVWKNTDSKMYYVYVMNGVSYAPNYINKINDANWVLNQIADVDEDGTDDLVWHHAKKGTVYVYQMKNAAVAAKYELSTVKDLDWQIAGVLSNTLPVVETIVDTAVETTTDSRTDTATETTTETVTETTTETVTETTTDTVVDTTTDSRTDTTTDTAATTDSTTNVVDPEPIAALPSGVEVTPNVEQYVNVNESISFVVEGLFDDNTSMVDPAGVFWNCAPSDLLTFEQNTATAGAQSGQAVCTASWEGYSEQVTINVEKPVQLDNAVSLVDLTVKEVAGVGSDMVISAVVPLPYGEYQSLDNLMLQDGNGYQVAAQFEVLNRWWGRDNSIRHALVHFAPNVDAYTAPHTGIANYTLVTSQTAQALVPNHPVQITETASNVVVNNGLIDITLDKTNFAIHTPAGDVLAELIDQDGLLQGSFDRDDITISVEENGPVRSVIKVSAPTLYLGEGKHQHGWAIRLYAYADSSYIKLDYQLQNSAINQPLSAPMYYQGLEISLDTQVATTAQQLQAVELTDDVQSKPYGVVGNSAASIYVRDFWQTWPNGVKAETDGRLVAELWPTWSHQFDGIKYADLNMYWLDDMRHAMKEVYIDFGNKSESARHALAASFQYPPVATLPLDWYADTKVTFDMGGYVGRSTPLADDDSNRKPAYSSKDYDMSNKDTYIFGWNNFKLDILRKKAPSTAGDWPYRNQRFLLSQNPKDYYDGLSFAMAELNIRPQWLAGYNYAEDFNTIKPTSNPYGGTTWRRFWGHTYPTLDSAYVAGSYQIAKPRDDQHGWFYQVEDAYYYTANPWIKDWFEFVGEFRKTRLNQQDPFPDMVSRAVGHSLNQAIAAYRVTGDTEILTLFDGYVQNHLMTRFMQPYLLNYVLGTTGRLTEASFQSGFFLHALINFYEEVGGNQTVYDIVKAYMDWNMAYSNFSYYNLINATEAAASDGTGLTMVDPQVWFAIKSGSPVVAAHAEQYVGHGIPHNVGKKPYGNFSEWAGQYEGRLYHYYKENLVNSAVLNVMDATVTEGDKLILTVGVSKETTAPFTAVLSTENGSALAGVDFEAQNIQLSFAAGEMIKRIEIPVYADMESEADEYFTVKLSNVQGVALGQSAAKITVKEASYEVIVDNVKHESSVTAAGNWSVSNYSQGFYYTNYHAHGPDSSNDSFTWAFNVAFAGDYEVYARWTVGSNRAADAAYELSDAAGSFTVTANQQANNGEWVKLGVATYEAGAQYIKLYANPNGYVMADAVMVKPLNITNTDPTQAATSTDTGSTGTGSTGTGSTDTGSTDTGSTDTGSTDTGSTDTGSTNSGIEIYVDNLDAGASMLGYWGESTYDKGFYDSNYQTHAPATSTDAFVWSFSIEAAGQYEVYARWTASGNRASNAVYQVTDATGQSDVVVNQQANGSTWVKLKVAKFEAGNYDVRLQANANGYVIADAIMLKAL